MPSRIRLASRSSACGAARSPRSGRRTRSSRQALPSIATTWRDGPPRSSSPSSATAPASTCFCTSMGTGPEVTGGFDLALTELDDGFVVRSGSPAGERPARAPRAAARRPTAQTAGAGAAVAAARAAIGDPVPTAGPAGTARCARRGSSALGGDRRALPRLRQLHARLPDLLLHERRRQVSDLDGASAIDRADVGQLLHASASPGSPAATSGRGPGPLPPVADAQVRAPGGTSSASSGCVGCGRCITWCPVGIDVREELLAIAPPTPTPAPRPIAPGPGARRPRPRDRSTLTVARRPCPDPIADDRRGRRRETADTVDAPPRAPTIRRSSPAAPGPVRHGRAAGVRRRRRSRSRGSGPDGLDLTIRAAGPRPRALIALPAGRRSSALRGPLGRGWPVEAAYGRDVDHRRRRHRARAAPAADRRGPRRPRPRFGAVRLYLRRADARRPAVRRRAVDALRAGRTSRSPQTVDRAGPEWLGRVGVVTQLFDRARLGRRPGDRLHLRPRADDAGDRRRPARARDGGRRGSG